MPSVEARGERGTRGIILREEGGYSRIQNETHVVALGGGPCVVVAEAPTDDDNDVPREADLVVLRDDARAHAGALGNAREVARAVRRRTEHLGGDSAGLGRAERARDRRKPLHLDEASLHYLVRQRAVGLALRVGLECERHLFREQRLADDPHGTGRGGGGGGGREGLTRAVVIRGHPLVAKRRGRRGNLDLDDEQLGRARADVERRAPSRDNARASGRVARRLEQPPHGRRRDDRRGSDEERTGHVHFSFLDMNYMDPMKRPV